MVNGVAPTTAGGGGGITLAEVAKHNTKTDCWVVVNGEVLNVTNFLSEHPGGELAILTFAGKDATEEFNMIHPPDVIPKYAPDAVIGSIGGGGGGDGGGVVVANLPPGMSAYTLEEVGKHTTNTDCWVVVNGEVLDVTSFLKEHPGGELDIPKRYHNKAIHVGYVMTIFIALVYISFPVYTHLFPMAPGSISPEPALP